MDVTRRRVPVSLPVRSLMDSEERNLAYQLLIRVLNFAESNIPSEDPDKADYLATIRMEATQRGILIYTDDPETAAIYEWGTFIDEMHPHWRLTYRWAKRELPTLGVSLVEHIKSMLSGPVTDARRAVMEMT